MKSVNECCQILGVDPGATSDEIKKAYRKLIKEWHPDRFLHNPRLYTEAQERLREINEAYDELQFIIAHRTDSPPHPSDDAGPNASAGSSRASSATPNRPATSPEPPPRAHTTSWQQHFLWLRRVTLLTVKDPWLIAACMIMLAAALAADWLTK